MPLSLSSLPEMLNPSSPGIVVVKRRSGPARRDGSSRIILTAQGSKVTRHAKGRR